MSLSPRVAVWRCPAYADSDASLSIRQGDRLVLGTRLRAAHVTTCRKAWPHRTRATQCVSSTRAAWAFGGCRAYLESGIRNRQQPCRALARAPELSSVSAERPLSATLPLPLCDQTDVYLPYRSNRIVFGKAVSTRPGWSNSSQRGRSRRQSPTTCRGGRNVVKLTLRHQDFTNCHSHTCSTVLIGPCRPVSPGG